MNENPTRRKAKYLTVRLRDNNNNLHTIALHKLIWEAFNGKVPEGKQLNHIDENTHNNDLSNLELVTPAQNCNHGTRNERIRSTSKGKAKPKQSFLVKVNNE